MLYFVLGFLVSIICLFIYSSTTDGSFISDHPGHQLQATNSLIFDSKTFLRERIGGLPKVKTEYVFFPIFLYAFKNMIHFNLIFGILP